MHLMQYFFCFFAFLVSFWLRFGISAVFYSCQVSWSKASWFIEAGPRWPRHMKDNDRSMEWDHYWGTRSCSFVVFASSFPPWTTTDSSHEESLKGLLNCQEAPVSYICPASRRQ
ncbi:hypothetical protein B0T19DRAFT_424676 [Cercophora scortea]|uniref:Uncharacterized protein n=1 Tax=Cercophora scortea TaxID=314031 RepID=A0AAE0MDE4_9PEZI|nr:hypothetical protein B0T19DRAFT_424676 [Cercophora scortea]